jgi:4-amino-4-deoxy-L-arabinose transferase-like glycosyltransferase
MLAAPLKQAALVAAVAAFVMLTQLGGTKLWDRDEPRNARCAWEMLARHDWVVPTFNGELRTHKPVLLYWLIMAAYSALGVNEFTARLPSALCAIGSALCTYRIGRRLFGPAAGVWAGIALATSLMFVVAGRASTPDSLLVFCSTLALMIYVCGTFRPRFETTPLDSPPQPIFPEHYFPQHWPVVLAMYGAMGLAVLAKGPVGLVLPTAVIGMFLLIVRRRSNNDVDVDSSSRNATEGVPYRRILAPFEPMHFLATCWYMRPFTAIFAAAAVALPWYWAVGLATNGEFLRGFFLEHNLARATGIMESHSGSILFYPMAILVGFFPWSVFAMPLAIDVALQLRRRDRFHAGYSFAMCWIGVYIVLFSLARTKLPSYITPCYPALALLVGDYIDRWSRQASAVAGGWLVAAFGCLAVVGGLIAVAVPLAAKRLLPGEEWLGLIGLVPLAGGVACAAMAAVRNYRAASATFALAAVSFVVLLFTVGADRVGHHQRSGEIWQAIYSRSGQPNVATYEALEPSWVFYSGHLLHEFRTEPGGAKEPTIRQAARFLEQHDTFVITTEEWLEHLGPALPPGVGVVQRTPYFLKEGRHLVVLGHGGVPANSIVRQSLPQLHLAR